MNALFGFRTMLRRTFAYFVLAFALLFAQHGGVAHELSHLANNASQQDKQLPHSKACDQCAAYAQVAGGAVSQSWLSLPHASAGPAIVFLGVAFAAPSYLSHLSRAPPVFA